RRRHTRFSRDWSSDVCSSDLPVPEAVFSRDGARLGTIGMDGSVRVWDASSGALLHTITGDERDSSYPSSIEFDPSGDAVLVGDRSEERRVGKGMRSRCTPVNI